MAAAIGGSLKGTRAGRQQVSNMGSSRTTRIGIDAGLGCSPRPTGVEYFARSLIGELLRLDHGGIGWYAYLPPYGDLGASPADGVRFRHRPDVNTAAKKPWLIAQTWRDRLDVLYTPGHEVPACCRGRRVITIHDTVYDRFPECYPPGVAPAAHQQVARACARAAAVVVPSQATRNALLSGYACHPDRVHVVGEASRPVFAAGPAGPLPERVAAAGIRAPFFLCVGRLDRRKNLERVIDAYRGLLARGMACGGMVIAGPEDGGSGAVRDRIAAGRVAGECIVVTGYVTEEELVSLYRGAVALVYPSLAEGFGLPVLEAMACGTPVITSNVSSMPEVAGDAALLVDPLSTEAIGAAMRAVILEQGLRERLSGAGLRRCASFTWRSSARRLLDVLLNTMAVM